MIRSTKDNVQISAPSTSIALELSIYTPSNSLILKEIYVTGTANDKGTNSLYDKYFVIYNNSSETVYADGVALLESTFGTTEKYQYNDNPQPMTTTFTAAAIYVIPGNGTEHPLAPANNSFSQIKATISHRPKPMPSICRSPISDGMTKPKKAWTRI